MLGDELENRIANILKKLMGRNPAIEPANFDSRAASRKQAMIPAGSQVIDPVGTARSGLCQDGQR